MYELSIHRIEDDGSLSGPLAEGADIDLTGVLETISFHLRTAPTGWAFDLTIVKYDE